MTLGNGHVWGQTPDMAGTALSAWRAAALLCENGVLSLVLFGQVRGQTPVMALSDMA